MTMSDFLNHASQNKTGSVREGKEVQKVLVNEKHGRRCASEWRINFEKQIEGLVQNYCKSLYKMR